MHYIYIIDRFRARFAGEIIRAGNFGARLLIYKLAGAVVERRFYRMPRLGDNMCVCVYARAFDGIHIRACESFRVYAKWSSAFDGLVIVLLLLRKHKAREKRLFFYSAIRVWYVRAVYTC